MMIRVSGDREQAEKLLASFEKNSNIVCVSSSGDSFDFEFDTKMNAEDKKQLFFAFAKNSMPILLQKETEVSLEEIFLKLISAKEANNESNIQ